VITDHKKQQCALSGHAVARRTLFGNLLSKRRYRPILSRRDVFRTIAGRGTPIPEPKVGLVEFHGQGCVPQECGRLTQATAFEGTTGRRLPLGSLSHINSPAIAVNRRRQIGCRSAPAELSFNLQPQGRPAHRMSDRPIRNPRLRLRVKRCADRNYGSNACESHE
jgi:hypothetical protein